MQKIIQVFALFLISCGTAFASWTVITTDYPVQCNNWGWVYGNTQTGWSNSCAPLSVQLPDREISVATTEGVCEDDQAAYYRFRKNDVWIQFQGCYPLSEIKKISL